MTRRTLVVPQLPSPAGPYAHVIDVGGLVFTAGFGPQDPRSAEVPDGIAAQTEQVLSNIQTALQAVDLTLDDVVKTTTHLQRLKRDFASYNEVYARFFSPPYPVRTTVGSQLFDILVEIDVVAVRPDSSRSHGSTFSSA